MAKVTVLEYERVVRLVDGRVREVLGPGRHRYRGRRTTLHRVDMRPYLVNVPGQEVLTADGVAVKVSAVLRVAAADAVALLVAAQNPQAEVYAAAQLAVRDAVARVAVETLVQGRLELPAELLEPVRAAAARVGLSVEEFTVRDLMLPGNLKQAFAELVLARQRGRVELERARGEVAALRSLANTADLLDRHPSLLRLRTLQAAESSEAKLVIKQ
ncbi:hypothetical protein Rhe02_21500 [Rhizocola hellebori]|uniref:Band 7 domain-containing protein n=1 Tax=Rhizocola hellebori TaxID=1392758 RepID=A0A8J3Q500_9ACTN|nr:slipin family protein [Rhizocola hellebori]GIH04083.1 hypothetical protein Rhe02_21500 [Rhizocola hellebori]